MTEDKLEVNGEERHLFADLDGDQYKRGMDWLSHEPVSFETMERPEDGQDWITLIMPTKEQLELFRQELGATG